jgi:hypothetical protein
VRRFHSATLSTKNGPHEILARAIQSDRLFGQLLFVAFIRPPVLMARILLLLAGIAATVALLALTRTLGLIALLLLALFPLVALLGGLILVHLVVVTIHADLRSAP